MQCRHGMVDFIARCIAATDTVTAASVTGVDGLGRGKKYQSGGICSERVEPWVIVGHTGRRSDGASIGNGNTETRQRKEIVLKVAAESAGKVEPVHTEASATSAHRDSNSKRNLRSPESEAAAPDREGHTQEQILLHNDGQPGSIHRSVSCLPPHPL